MPVLFEQDNETIRKGLHILKEQGESKLVHVVIEDGGLQNKAKASSRTNEVVGRHFELKTNLSAEIRTDRWDDTRFFSHTRDIGM